MTCFNRNHFLLKLTFWNRANYLPKPPRKLLFIDDQQFVRVNGRLRHAQLDFCCCQTTTPLQVWSYLLLQQFWIISPRRVMGPLFNSMLSLLQGKSEIRHATHGRPITMPHQPSHSLPGSLVRLRGFFLGHPYRGIGGAGVYEIDSGWPKDCGLDSWTIFLGRKNSYTSSFGREVKAVGPMSWMSACRFPCVDLFSGYGYIISFGNWRKNRIRKKITIFVRETRLPYLQWVSNKFHWRGYIAPPLALFPLAPRALSLNRRKSLMGDSGDTDVIQVA